MTYYDKVAMVQKELMGINCIFPSALRWTADDVDMALERLNHNVDWSKQDKINLLEKFFNIHEDYIVEFINNSLIGFIEEKISE
jgi:hypothetical protein